MLFPVHLERPFPVSLQRLLPLAGTGRLVTPQLLILPGAWRVSSSRSRIFLPVCLEPRLPLLPVSLQRVVPVCLNFLLRCGQWNTVCQERLFPGGLKLPREQLLLLGRWIFPEEHLFPVCAEDSRLSTIERTCSCAIGFRKRTICRSRSSLCHFPLLELHLPSGLELRQSLCFVP